MPPKRPSSNDNNNNSPKRPRGRAPSEDAPNDAMREVNWVLPARGRSIDERDEDHQLTRYAQLLYGRPWESLTVPNTTFGWPRIRTPVYRKKSTTRQTPGNHNERGSAATCRLFEVIKHDTQPSLRPGPAGLYARTAFVAAFTEHDDDLAIAASRSNTNPIVALTQDYQVQVTLPIPNGFNVIHSINIIRRSAVPDLNIPGEAGASDVGYFVQLLPGDRAIVNGRTYRNDAELAGNNVAGDVYRSIIIGPLTRYTVIEVLTQPIFFFRAREDLDYTQPLTKSTLSHEEIQSRVGQVDADSADVTITWTPLSELPEERPHHVEEDDPQYSDGWTDSGEDNPSAYIESHVVGPQHALYDSLVPRIIAAINGRQPVLAGLSFRMDEVIMRPGRTFLVPLQQGDYNILLTAQITEDRQIRIRMLDPMAWRSTIVLRTAFVDRARQAFTAGSWWHQAFDSQAEMLTRLPEIFEWAPSAQHTSSEQSLTYTVLNAWALALGLEPNPKFRPSEHGNEFFILTHQLFQLALDDKLNWKVLVAFLRSTGFVKRRGTEAGAASHDTDIAQSRKFDLRKRPFQLLLQRQTQADAEAQARANDGDALQIVDSLALSLENGVPHNSQFASDSLDEGDLDGVRALVRRGDWSLVDTSKELKQRIDQQLGLSKPTSSNAGQDAGTNTISRDTSTHPKEPHGSAETGTDRSNEDTSELPADFDPCHFSRAELKKLIEANPAPKLIEIQSQGDDNGISHVALSESQILNSILVVARAINESLPHEQGFEVSPGEINVSNSGSANQKRNRVILRPQEHDGHNILFLLQTADEVGTVVFAIDSAFGTFDEGERRTLRTTLLSLEYIENLIPRTIQWISGPQQFEMWQSGYFTILNAWAILFGLRLNSTKFSPEEAFFEDARQLFHSAQQGHVSWKVIWAFLRCADYIDPQEPPAQDRRFSSTVSANDLQEHRTRQQTKPKDTAQDAKADLTYPYFTPDLQLPHDGVHPWDHLGAQARRVWVPALTRAGMLGSLLTSEEIGSAFEKLSRTPACRDFRNRLNERLKDPSIVANLRDLRYNGLTTHDYGQWLVDEELYLSIAAITLAITEYQGDLDLGFSVVGPYAAHSFYDTPALRPGRPLIFALNHENHFILLVIQLDEHAKPRSSILDSKAYHLVAKDREAIHTEAWGIVTRAQWGRCVFPLDDLEQHRPSHTSWIPVSQQGSDWECGYYAILNAWTLALGLEPNPHIVLDWTDQFFDDLLDVLHLSRIGRADWQLIHVFLRCNNFVRGGVVPYNRRFTNTVELTSMGPILAQAVDKLSSAEEAFLNENPQLDMEKMKNANRIVLPPGRRHDDGNLFPSDRWKDRSRADNVSDLARHGRLDLSHNDQQLRIAHARLKSYRGEEFIEQLQNKNANWKVLSSEEIREECTRKLHDWRNGKTKQRARIWCETWDDTRDFYQYIFDHSILGKKLLSPTCGKLQPGKSLDAECVNLPIAAVVDAIDSMQSEDYRSDLGDPFTGGFALCTSLTAEMALRGETFGGHTSRPRRCWILPLCIAGQILEDLNDWRVDEGLNFTKPRPRDAGGHHLLAVVQQEPTPDGAKRIFLVYFFDSGSHVLRGAYPFLAERIAEGSKVVGWSTQRNEPPTMKLEHYDDLPVSVQLPGGWQCGAHTIVNAWIVALGLHPRKVMVYREEIYEEAFILARAACSGILDWMALVSWLFCRGLTVEKTLDSVRLDRRFPNTRFWRNEAALEEVIEATHDEDQIIGTASEAELPYDFSNSFVPPPEVDLAPSPGSLEGYSGDLAPLPGSLEGFSGDLAPSPGSLEGSSGDLAPSPGSLEGSSGDLAPSPSSSEGSLDDSLDDSSDLDLDGEFDEDLYRSFEDPATPTPQQRSKHRLYSTSRPVTLDFLRAYDDGDINMTTTQHPAAARKRRRGPDRLLFLDAF